MNEDYNMKIYEHNRVAYNNVKETFEKFNRTCVIHPTGTGKTYITLQLLLDNVDKKILLFTSYSTIFFNSNKL